MKDEDIERINELAHKKKNSGLSEEEKAEQAMLYGQFIKDVRGQVINSLKEAGMQPRKKTLE